MVRLRPAPNPGRAWTSSGRVEQLLDRAQFGVPPGQLGLQPVDPLAAAHPGQHPGGPPQRLRLRLAFQRVLSGMGETDRAVRQPLRRRVDQHRAGFGRRLHPGRGIHCIPCHHALADRAQRDRDLPGYHPGPRRQTRHASLRSQVGHRCHQVQRGAHRPLRITFGRRRRSPDRHHRVADELLHHPAIAADDRPRDLEITRQQLPDRLRIA